MGSITNGVLWHYPGTGIMYLVLSSVSHKMSHGSDADKTSGTSKMGRVKHVGEIGEK